MALAIPEISNPANGIDTSTLEGDALVQFQVELQQYNIMMSMWASIVEADANAKKAVANKIS
jgi:hypothetical protein